MEISRERRSPAKLSDCTGPVEGTEGRKTETKTMDGWMDAQTDKKKMDE